MIYEPILVENRKLSCQFQHFLGGWQFPDFSANCKYFIKHSLKVWCGEQIANKGQVRVPFPIRPILLIYDLVFTVYTVYPALTSTRTTFNYHADCFMTAILNKQISGPHE